MKRSILLVVIAAGLLAFTPGVLHASASPAPLSPDLHEISTWGEHAKTAQLMLIVFQLAAMLAAAKLAGWAIEKIGVPGVVGELLAGVIIGPYLLGNLIHLPLGSAHWVPLFPAPSVGQWPVNDVIWAIAQIASIVLLFVTGLQTDLQQFLKYVGPASLIALVGFLIPMLLGTGVVYIPQFAAVARASADQSLLVPALFVGAILAATSIGITARVLGDLRKLDTPEGVTILGAAVLDDVLGIIALAIVAGIAESGSVSFSSVGRIAGLAFGFWIGLTLLTLLLARPIERLLGKIKYSGAVVGLGLALALACSGAAESAGLAFIIGAYSVGLGLSRTQLARQLMNDLRPICDFIVPIFFAALGMLVNPSAMFSGTTAVMFGLAVTAAAIIGKLIGCGAAALPMGFNRRGAYRIGVGMLPRGEVALIVAGVGLSRHLIGDTVFGVSILMTLITTVLAPILLKRAFNGPSGRRRPGQPKSHMPQMSALAPVAVAMAPSLRRLFVHRLIELAAQGGRRRQRRDFPAAERQRCRPDPSRRVRHRNPRQRHPHGRIHPNGKQGSCRLDRAKRRDSDQRSDDRTKDD